MYLSGLFCRVSVCLCAWGRRLFTEAIFFLSSNTVSLNSVNNLFTPYGILAICQVWMGLGTCEPWVEILFKKTHKTWFLPRDPVKGMFFRTCHSLQHTDMICDPCWLAVARDCPTISLDEATYLSELFTFLPHKKSEQVGPEEMPRSKIWMPFRG